MYKGISEHEKKG